jgi:hypothetical protein
VENLASPGYMRPTFASLSKRRTPSQWREGKVRSRLLPRHTLWHTSCTLCLWSNSVLFI